MGRLGTQTIEILNAPLVDSPRGTSSVRDWVNAEVTVVEGCNVQPFKLAEKLAYSNDSQREFSKSGFRVYAPGVADGIVTAESKVRYRGTTYEVLGITGTWFRLDGTIDHVAFVIRERRG